MTRPFQQWTVLPHSKLAQIDESILSVVGEIRMPLMDLPRRMTVVHLDDDGLVVFSTNSLGEDEMSARVVRTPKGTTLVLNDVVGNTRDAAGFGGWLLHVRGGFCRQGSADSHRREDCGDRGHPGTTCTAVAVG